MDAGPTAAVGAWGGNARKRKGYGEAGAAGADATTKKPRSLCPHQRRRSECKECGGSAICQHQRLKSRCKECGTEAHASISDRPGRVPISERQEDGSAAQSADPPQG